MQQGSLSHRQGQQACRFLNLPAEIRCNILELSLIRGQVALASDEKIRQRYPDWSHERPQWALVSAVSRQVQHEASDVLYSGRNTFVLPFVDRVSVQKWSQSILKVKRLDVAFSMRDLGTWFRDISHSVAMTKRIYSWNTHDPSGEDFENLGVNEKRDMIHTNLVDWLWDTWNPKIDLVKKPCLDMLRIDLSNCRCSVGCCRFGINVLEDFAYNHDSNVPESYRSGPAPKKIEIVGAVGAEERQFKKLLIQLNEISEDRVTLVNDQTDYTVMAPNE